MNNKIGYVLVSKVHARCHDRCEKCPENKICRYPKIPNCNAICLHHENHLEVHPECSQYEKDVVAWNKAHPLVSVPIGGTRLGPLHYFSDCQTLLHRGPRRKDARVIPIDSGVATDFELPICKACQLRMAPLEKQFEPAESIMA